MSSLVDFSFKLIVCVFTEHIFNVRFDAATVPNFRPFLSDCRSACFLTICRYKETQDRRNTVRIKTIAFILTEKVRCDKSCLKVVYFLFLGIGAYPMHCCLYLPTSGQCY